MCNKFAVYYYAPVKLFIRIQCHFHCRVPVEERLYEKELQEALELSMTEVNDADLQASDTKENDCVVVEKTIKQAPTKKSGKSRQKKSSLKCMDQAIHSILKCYSSKFYQKHLVRVCI